ncbi:hypothetical protein GCM10023347_51180 [Streptomyces chumphonensis]
MRVKLSDMVGILAAAAFSWGVVIGTPGDGDKGHAVRADGTGEMVILEDKGNP